MTFLTDFGDLAILSPLSVLILAWLLWARPWQAAAWWTAALALCIGGIGLSKMYLFACSSFVSLQSPSGHTGFAVLVYGALAGFIALSVGGWARATALAAGAALVGGIAVSRLVLGAHNTVEVLVGSVIGAAALALFFRRYVDVRPRPIPARPLLLIGVLVAALMHGHELHAEEMLHALSLYLKAGAGTAICR